MRARERERERERERGEERDREGDRDRDRERGPWPNFYDFSDILIYYRCAIACKVFLLFINIFKLSTTINTNSLKFISYTTHIVETFVFSNISIST